MPPGPATAVVVGGGIAGLAAAAGLTRAGWSVTVFEQAPAFEPVGAGIALAPNGVRALEWLGHDAQRRPRRRRVGRVAARGSPVVRVREPVAVGGGNPPVPPTPPAV